jgi:hypothetical protein
VQVVGAGGLTLGAVSKKPSLEVAVRLEQWAAAGGGRLAVPDLPDMVRAFVNLKGEAWRLNRKQRERERGLAEARRAHSLLAGLRGLEGALELPVGVRSECVVKCRLPGRPEQEYSALLLGGSRRCLALCTDLLQPDRRACHWSVDLAYVEAVTEQDSARSSPAIGGVGAAMAAPAAGESTDEDAGGLMLVLRLAPVHRNDPEFCSSDIPSHIATGEVGLSFGNCDISSMDGNDGGTKLNELELRSPWRREGTANDGTAPVQKAANCMESAEAVPLEAFARDLIEAVEAEALKRRSLSSARQSMMMAYPQGGAGGAC